MTETLNDAATDCQKAIAELQRKLAERTVERDELVQRHNATADVLKVISRSAFDLDTVLETLISTATRLCNCEPKGGQIFRREGDVYRYAASQMNVDPDYLRHEQTAVIRPGRGTLIGRVALSKRTVMIADAWSDPEYEEKDAAQTGKVRAMLGVPLLRDGEPIGAFALARSEPIAFTEREVELVNGFADQAVIAIENARLFNENKEALERQTATADILKVIASSPSDVQPVFEAIAASAKKLIGGFSAVVHRFIGDDIHLAAFTPISPEADAALQASFPTPISQLPIFLQVRGGETAEFADTEAEEVPQLNRDLARLRGYRSMLFTPLMNNGAPIGMISVTRKETGSFADHHVELVRTFADQAVIAIENTRLFDEVEARTNDLQESLEYQTATSDVLKVISRSSFDLQPVLDTLIGSAVKLCGALNGTICLREGDGYRYRASSGIHGDWAKFLDEHPPTPGRGSMTGRVLLSGRPESVPDVLEDPDYVAPLAAMNKTRSVFGVPLLRDDKVEGVLLLARAEPGLFTQRQIELVQTFADQAVIAIENARLLTELRQRTDDLTESLEHLRAAQDRLVQTEKLASLGQLTAGIAHEIKNPLNFVNNFSALSAELIDELDETLAPAPLDQRMRGSVGELTQMLKSNLEKVVQHGKRADSIVKNMLLHSREGSGEQRPADINALLDESLNLAYHGARAEKPGFNITLQRDLDPNAGVIELFPQEITRALLNLISNGFYAATKRQEDAGDGFEPTLTATTTNLGDKVEIRIRDNGIGIPTEVREKIFNPFFTTKPAGEGTGLGLSMSHDIIVKQHGGRIEVDTSPGAFTEFRIILPRAGHP